MKFNVKKTVRSRRVAFGAGIAAVFLGFTLLLEWYFHESPLTQALPPLIPGASIALLMGFVLYLARKSVVRAKELEQLMVKQAQALKVSEELGRLSISSASQGIYDLDIKTGKVSVSPEYATMLGYDPREYSLTMDSWIEQLHPDDREATLAQYTAYLAGEDKEYRVEFRERTKSGEWKWILSVAQFVEWDEDGSPLRMLGTHTDITEQEETKIELARLARFPEENPNPVLRFSKEGELLYSNQAGSRLIRLGMRENADFKDAFSRVFEEQSPVQVDLALDTFFYAVTLASLFGMDSVNVYGLDITERMTARRERNELARFPEENPNPVMRLSATGDLLYGNQASQILVSHGMRGRASFRAAVSQALESGVPENVEMRFGDAFYIITVAPISELDVVNVYGLDITQRQKAFESLRAAEMRLKETVSELTRSNKDLEQFAYVSSHDLQEPLRMVSNYVQLVAKRYKGQLDEEADEFIAYAVDGVRRMSELINGLLEYSRVQTATRPPAPVNCNELIKNILHDMSNSIQSTDATVSVDPLPVILGDRMQIGRVFQNLIANAIKFRGPNPPEIHVRGVDEGLFWHFQVEDNGIGVEPEYAETIFGLFKRLHSREKYSGTGIGLAVCRRIMDQHRGEIWTESGVDDGSVFHFTVRKGDETNG